MTKTEPKGAASARALLTDLVGDHEDLNREGLAETPGRMAKALRQLTSGYGTDPAKLVTTFPAEGDQVVSVREVPFASVCEHHVLPFTGYCSVAYIPQRRIIGLSKIPRVVRAVARRLQVQERIGNQVADVLEQALDPVGVAVVVRAVHTCMCLRGVESHGEMVTSVMRGAFKHKSEARAEVMRLFNVGVSR